MEVAPQSCLQKQANESALQTGEHLRTLSRLMVELQQLNFTCCDINSVTQCGILTTLAREGDQTLVSLTRALNLDKAWLSRTTDSMVEEGLVTKKRHPVDRRALLIQLTEAGEQAAKALNDQLNTQAARVFQRLPEGDRQQTVRLLKLLEEALIKEIAITPHC